MRAIPVAAAIVVAMMVSSCDINTTPKEAKVGCNCTPAAAQPPAPGETAPPSEPIRHHRHAHYGMRYAGGGRGHYWRREYSELSVITYDYRSASRSYAMDEDTSGGGTSASAYAAAGGSVAGAWVDGFGRSHGGGEAVVTGGGGETTVRAGDDRARLKPWHGYDVDCPDKPGR